LALALPARAKLNLDLEVLGRRPDGFHDIRTTFQAIELHDMLEVEPAQATTFTSEGFDVDRSDNSVLRAHRALEEQSGRRLPARLHLQKRIPPGSGMGGASSDAAATLRALKSMHGLDIDLPPLAQLVGADVPFFLAGGRARAEGRGERLEQLSDHEAWFAIAWPGIELATPDVYRAWDEVKGDGPNHLRRAAERVDPRLAEFARSLGAGWQMTGSGSAFFLRTPSEEEGRKAVEPLGRAGRAQGAPIWTTVTRAVGRWA
jgi:4-diphosphocytidyl-2-C-methyl-D-erythritol kinase